MSSIASGTSIDYATPDTPRVEPDLIAPPIHEQKLVWRWFTGLALGLLGFYLLLQNPYWVPGGDSDFYVAIARNLALSGSYTYNGLPVAISPPGWPWVMAAVLKVSPYFLSIKLVTMLCMWGSLLIGYFVALRFAPPRIAALSVGLAGILMPVYSLTFFLHSEGLYCLLSAGALLLAFRARESTERYGSWAGLIVICIAIPFIRWAGVIQLLPIVAVLLSGKWSWAGQNRRWLLAGLCVIVIIATWLGTRYSLELTADEIKALAAAGGTSTLEEEAPEISDDATSPTLVPIATGGQRSVPEEYAQRLVRAGKWFSWLLWHPTRFAGPVNKWLDSGVSLLGWFTIVILGYVAIRRLIKGDLLWFSLAIYCGALCMNWPNPNARYLVPVAPLIVLGIFIAIRDASESFPTPGFDWGKWARRAFVYTVLLCNIALYGVDVIVMRSSNFYDDFEAGQHKDLVNIAHHLGSFPVATTQPASRAERLSYRPEDGRIMINERYENLDRIRFSKAGMRAMVLLTDLDIKPLDKGFARFVHPEDPATSEFGKRFPTRLTRFVRARSDWLLIQSPAVPWRVWHFRLPMEYHEKFTRNPGRPPSGGWTLYLYDEKQNDLVPTPVPAVEDWPKRVPGM